MKIERYGSRNWAVYDDCGDLICITVYKKGAIEVVNRLSGEGRQNRSQPYINLKELSELEKEIRQLNRKFSNIFKEIKSGNKLTEAVL